jgi:hypothetical protein
MVGSMGRMQAEEMRAFLDEDLALGWHLQSNHYPPIPAEAIPVAKAAIEAAANGDWEAEIELPENIEHKRYGRKVPACEVIEEMHLETFVDARIADDE